MIRYKRKFKNNTSLIIGLVYNDKQGLIRLSGIDTDEIKVNDLTCSGVRFACNL